jgi:hypothetical protein
VVAFHSSKGAPLLARIMAPTGVIETTFPGRPGAKPSRASSSFGE